MQKTGSRLRVVTALAATVLLGTGALTGCSSDNKSPSAGTTAQAATSTQAAADHAGMGAPVKGKGATVTVTGAFETDTIELNPEGRKPGTSPTEPTSARQGGKYVVIQTKVVNDSPRDMDMTCGFGVQAELQTDQSASYKPIDSLYRIPGNPDCNENLGSGFDTDMTWVFLIPEGRKPLTFGFADPETAYNDLTYVALDKFGQKSPATGKQPSPTTGTPADGSGDTATSSDAIAGDTGGGPYPTADPGTGSASAPDSAASDDVSPAADPVIGFTGAPSVDSPHVLDKEIAGCGDPALHQTGTTFFTDGTSGWTESCAAQMG